MTGCGRASPSYGLSKGKGALLWTECCWNKEQEATQQLGIQYLVANSKAMVYTRGKTAVLLQLGIWKIKCLLHSETGLSWEGAEEIVGEGQTQKLKPLRGFPNIQGLISFMDIRHACRLSGGFQHLFFSAIFQFQNDMFRNDLLSLNDLNRQSCR